MIKLVTPVALTGIMALSACNTTRPALAGQHESFGQANKANIAAHSITPDPVLKANTFIPADRDRARAAREAYRKGEVKELQPLRSQSD